MTKNESKQLHDFIMPLYINGMQGRMLRMPALEGKKREILFVYGHHSSLERWWGVIQDLNQYGAVTVPDLPGFGGMDSFYKIGKPPTIDNMADYLASFIKLRYKRKRVTIMALSFGFVVVTRMLQRYPDLVKKVDVLISVVGFSHKSDFKFSRQRYVIYRYLSGLLAYHIPSILFRSIALHPLMLRLGYAKTHNAKVKFAGMSKAERKMTMQFEIHLWHTNDVRTHWSTCRDFLLLDNCRHQVDLPVWHIAISGDQYFDDHTVEQHLRVIFSDVHVVKAKSDAHAPSVVADMDAAAKMIPLKIRQLLSEKL